jgi:hypothetical protein
VVNIGQLQSLNLVWIRLGSLLLTWSDYLGFKMLDANLFH